MESRSLAIVSLVLLINVLFVLPSHSAAHKTKKFVKQSHTRTLKKVITKTKRVVSQKKVSKTLVHKPSKSNIWMTPIRTAPYSISLRKRLIANFKNGRAGKHSPEDLVRAKAFVHVPLKGGIRKRTGPVRYLVLHSTETERPADGRRVVQSWNNIGRSHPGTQFLVDRDGTIILTADPNFATIHVNDRTATRGVNNDNSIGIELVRSGKQKYTYKQLRSLVALTDYIEDRFNISRVYGHGEIQPSDRRDPVAFNWGQFSKNLASIRRGPMDAETAYNYPSNSFTVQSSVQSTEQSIDPPEG